MKNNSLFENFSILEVKFSIYLNRRVFVMKFKRPFPRMVLMQYGLKWFRFRTKKRSFEGLIGAASEILTYIHHFGSFVLLPHSFH